MAHPIEKATPAVASPDQHLALFGPPRLLEGEDSAVYDALYASVCAAVKPRDIIEEILVNDFIAREWDVLRYRRQMTAIDFLTVDALTDYDRLTVIERMDRLATVAELRREAALKELDRHRLVLGEAARQLVQDVEDGEFEEIEAAADGKAAS